MFLLTYATVQGRLLVWFSNFSEFRSEKQKNAENKYKIKLHLSITYDTFLVLHTLK